MPVVSTLAPNVWFTTFLAVSGRQEWFQRKESRPPLYRYRCSEEEFRQLQRLLSGQESALRQARSRELSALFCLYVAEWFRRNYRGGVWTWDGVLASLSLHLEYSEAQLYALVEQGLLHWGRPVMRSRRRNFLMSLVCEGGVPAELVTEEAARFRPFFRELLADHQTFAGTVPTTELASRLASAADLPHSLRRDIVYELCGDLVASVHNLQALVQGAEDPLQQLDQQHPGWKDTLPLQLSEGASLTLVRGLLDDARQVKAQEATRLRISTHLRLEGTEGSMQRRVGLPSKLTGAQLEQLFGSSGLTAMGRFTLQLGNESGKRTSLAMLTRDGEETACYVVEFSRREHLLHAAQTVGELSLVLVSSSGGTWSTVPAGGEARSELPWIFAAEPDAEGQIGAHWRLLSEGSVHTRQPRVLIAVDPKDRVEHDAGAPPRWAGVLKESERVLYLVEGTVRIRCASEGTCVVSTGGLNEDFMEPRFQGARVETGRGSVYFRGMPKVLSQLANGAARTVGAGSLQWRPARTHSWRPFSSEECVGAIELRHVEHDKTHWQARLAVLPETSRIELQPQAQENVGRVLVSGTRAVHLGVHPQPQVQAAPLARVAEGHGYELRATGTPPSQVRVELRWAREQYLTLDLVFPAQGAYFRARDGQLLPSGAELMVDRLGGTQVEVILPGRRRPPRLSMTLRQKDDGTSPPLDIMLDVAVDGGKDELYTLDLACVEASVRALFSSSTDLDSSVELRILGGASRSRALIVKRYDLTFDFQRAQGELQLLQGAGSGEHAEERVQVRAVPLRAPEAAELLSWVRPGCWRFAFEGRRPGPWLILGSEASWSRVRPRLLTVDPQRQDAARSPLDEAIIARPEERAEKMRAVMRALAQDANAPDWKQMMVYVDMLAELPATTFDALVKLSEHPAAAALALFVREPQRIDTLWRGLEQLPFSWALVPVRDWRAAARVWATGWKQAVAQLPEAHRRPLREYYLKEFATLSQAIKARLPGLEPVLMLIQEELEREPVRVEVKSGQPVRSPSRTSMPAITAFPAMLAFRELREKERTQLFTSHDGEAWPQAEKLEEERRALMAHLPSSLRGLFAEDSSVVPERLAVVQAPVLAALCSAWGQGLSVRARLELRRIQDFAPAYFAFVQGFSSRLALAELQVSAPDRLK